VPAVSALGLELGAAAAIGQPPRYELGRAPLTLRRRWPLDRGQLPDRPAPAAHRAQGAENSPLGAAVARARATRFALAGTERRRRAPLPLGRVLGRRRLRLRCQVVRAVVGDRAPRLLATRRGAPG